MGFVSRRFMLVSLFALGASPLPARAASRVPNCASKTVVGAWTAEVISVGNAQDEAGRPARSMWLLGMTQPVSVEGRNGARPDQDPESAFAVVQYEFEYDHGATARRLAVGVLWPPFSRGGSHYDKETRVRSARLVLQFAGRSAEVAYQPGGRSGSSRLGLSANREPLNLVAMIEEPTLAAMTNARQAQATLFVDGSAALTATVDLAGLVRARASGMRDLARLKNDKNRNQCRHSCFLTTATCEALGLPDDCFELTMLRRFRDDVLSSTPAGQHEIASYYALAPRVMCELAPRWDRRQWLGFYLGLVLPCALLIRLGAHRLAHALYRRRVAGLVKQLDDAMLRPGRTPADIV